MSMTNYMELLMTNQPYNLIFFMAIPVILAESLVVTEFYCLWRGKLVSRFWQDLNRLVGIILGIYFSAVFIYLLTTVIPDIQWRGILDKIAVFSYLFGVIPLLAITLFEFGIIGKNLRENARKQFHFLLLTAFLILSHIAMIFGMTEPEISEIPITHEHHEHMHN